MNFIIFIHCSLHNDSRRHIFNYTGTPQLEWPVKRYYGAHTWALAMSNEITAEYRLKRIGLQDGNIIRLRNYVLRNDIKVIFGIKDAPQFLPMPEGHNQFSAHRDSETLRHLVLGDDVAAMEIPTAYDNPEDGNSNPEDSDPEDGNPDLRDRLKTSFDFKLGLQYLLNNLRVTDSMYRDELIRNYFKKYKGETLPFKELFRAISLMAELTFEQVHELYKSS